jgi:hypothetical protein
MIAADHFHLSGVFLFPAHLSVKRFHVNHMVDGVAHGCPDRPKRRDFDQGCKLL